MPKPLKIVGLMVTRNEGWILPYSIPAALAWVDQLLILQHACTDDTAGIVDDLQRQHGARITTFKESSPLWDEATYRQKMLVAGRLLKGTHFALIDSDEVLTRNLHGKIKDHAYHMEPAQCLRLPWHQVWRAPDQYRSDDSPFGRAKVSVLFSDGPGVSHELKPNGTQIHTRSPSGCKMVEAILHRVGGVLHYQHVSWRRLLAKQALYKMTETLRWKGLEGHSDEQINRRYDPTVDETGLEVTPIPFEWKWGVVKVNFDSVPWQEAECRRLIREHGAERFAGLNLYGVV